MARSAGGRAGGVHWIRAGGHWLRARTFAPAWLPLPLRRPLVGYACGTLLAGGAVAPEYLLNEAFPEFEFPDAFSYVVIVGTALLWGMLAALCASLVSALAINYFIVAPRAGWNLSDPTDLAGFGVSLASFGTLSLIASMAEGRRRDLADRQAREMALERERARAAEELARLRSDLVAAVSHELRTPLTAIVGFGELLLARWAEFSDARRQERIAQIVQAANRQKRLVEDLLLLGGLDRGAMPVAATTATLAPLVGRAVDEVRGAYPGQVIGLAGPEDLAVLADPDRVVQILANLLDNAAKYSPPGSPVEVAWRAEEGRASVRVRDRGQGIAEADRTLLFTRFGRLPGSRIRAGHVGTGLGLYLSRRLAEAMGGDLDLEATGLQGSTFRLRLPTATGPAAPPVDGGAERR